MLDIENLTIGVSGPGGQIAPIVSDVSFRVASGESVGLVGEAGSGKSLLVHAIAGLVRPPLFAKGVIRFGGRDLLSMDVEAKRGILGRELGIILPGSRTRLNPLERVGKQIARIALDHEDSLSREQAESRALGLLERVGIPDPHVRLRSYPHELSGGLAKRVLIAMSLVNRPRFIVADEPTSDLDVSIQRQILEDLGLLLRDEGVGLLIVTRDLGIVAHYCRRVIVLSAGRATEDAEVHKFFARPDHPYSKRLLEATLLERDHQEEPHHSNAPPPRRSAGREVAVLRRNDMSMVDEPLIEARRLVKHFPIPGRGALVAVGGIDLTIPKGRTVGLVGESGSGKTTVGRLIVRLTEPTAGEVWYRGQCINRLSRGAFRASRSKLQMVFQDPASSLNPRMTVRQTLADALHNLRLSRAEREVRIAEVLDAVGLPSELGDVHPEALTGSQQQRCAISRALIMQPDLIILDESVSNLDVMGRYEIVELLRDVQRRFSISYLFISHDLTAVRRVSDVIYVMYLGRIVEVAATGDLFARPIHPYTRSLLGAGLYPDPNAERPTYTLKGEIPSPIDLPDGCPLYSRCPIAEAACKAWEPHLIRLRLGGAAPRLAACRRADEQIESEAR